MLYRLNELTTPNIRKVAQRLQNSFSVQSFKNEFTFYYVDFYEELCLRLSSDCGKNLMLDMYRVELKLSSIL